MLAFQKVEAYQAAIELIAWASTLSDDSKEDGVASRLRFTTLGIPIDIAGAKTNRQKHAYVEAYAQAREGAIETAVLLDALKASALVDDKAYDEGIARVSRLLGALKKTER
jgi:23S rRNA-intervening sequence protein